MKILFTTFFIFIIQFGIAQNFDINTLRQTNVNRNQALDNFFCTYSNSIAVPTICMPIAVYAIGIFKKNKAIQINGINMAISAGINGGVTYLAKQLVDRPRPAVTYPFLTPLENRTHYSFPSGHTSSAFNTATTLSIAYPKWYIIAPAYTYASVMAYSRMHIGVHYPSDVLAGALLGASSAYLSHAITKKIQTIKKINRYYKQLIF